MDVYLNKIRSLPADKQLRVQAEIIKCISTLHKSDNIDEAIDELLEAVAEFYDADRGYIFEFNKDRVTMNNTYEWCREGVVPAKDMLQELEISTIDRWLIYFEQAGEFYINSRAEEVSEESEEYRLLAAQGIDSLMAAPIKKHGGIIGFIGVDNPRDNTDNLLFMQAASAFIINDIDKRVTIEERVLSSIAAIYDCMYLINVPENTLREFSSNVRIRRYLVDKGNACNQIYDAVMALISDEYAESASKFFVFTDLSERMADTNAIGCEFLAKNGHWCRGSYIAVSRDEDNNIIEAVCAIQYIDKEKKKELEYQSALKKALENQNEIYAEMLHIQGCGVIASYADSGNVIIVNDAALQILGAEKLDNLYQAMFESIVADDKVSIEADFKDQMAQSGRFSAEYAIQRPNGDIVYVMSEVRAAILAGGERVMINSLMDITEKKKLENELLILSETDSLTRISNRRSGEAKILRLLADGQKGMYCLFDIDKFKAINDSFGHSIGDKALIETACCLKNSFRSTDVIMRLGGDEFAVFVVGVDNEQLGEQSIKRFFGELGKVSIPEMDERKISVSLGAVLCGGDNSDYEKIYAEADAVMYECKKSSGNNFRFCRKE